MSKPTFNYFNEITFSPQFEKIFENCFYIPNTLCLGGTSSVISADNIHRGLIGKWTFDDMYAIDYSSNNNHMHKFIRPAPGFNGYGYSGAFLGGNIIHIFIQYKFYNIYYFVHVNIF